MACGSGCCGPRKSCAPTNTEQLPQSQVLEAINDSCHDNDSLAANNATTDAYSTDNEPTQPATAGNVSTVSVPLDGIKESGCCIKVVDEEDDCKPHETASTSCENGCCDGLAENPNVPSCCRGKTSPCCDISCLDRIAIRACKEESEATQFLTSGASSGCLGQQDGKPCSYHTRTTHDKFTATLEVIGCICRALLALGQESCCPPRERSSVVGSRRCSKKGSFSRPSGDTYCITRPNTTTSPAKWGSKPKRGSRSASPVSTKGACLKGCCTPRGPSASSLCDDACSVREKPQSIPKKVISSTALHENKLEQGLAGTEHFVLSVSGMTCTGCETKLKRSLGAIESVGNLKTSLILSRAEFDLDLSVCSLGDVMKRLERTTGFKCERVTNQGSSIQVVAPSDPNVFVGQSWPDGVIEMTVVGEETVNVTFDPTVTGARDLVENGWTTPIGLAPPRPDPTLEAGSKHVRHVGLMTCLSMVVTLPVLVMAWAPLPKRNIAYASASLALATIVQFTVAGPFYSRALKALVFSRVVEMDLLIVLSTSAAYIFSIVSFGYLVAGRPLSTGEFFETSTLLVTLIMFGRYVSALARQKAVESVTIRSLQTSNAVLVNEAGEENEIDSRLLQYGDIFRVSPDSSIPTDGTVIFGSSEVDESMITGESNPVQKSAKSPVIAGSINGTGTLVIRLTRLPGENTISSIARMVDEAKLSKPRIQHLADRIASYFVPVVAIITILTFVIWVVVGMTVRAQSSSEAAVQAITYAITVLIVSCPCGIGLAVPMVVVIASGVAAERGVIIKSADTIEAASKTSCVVFDKTGTLTEGKLTVAREEYTGNDPSSTKSLLLGLVNSNKHPVSAAVASHLRATGVPASVVPDPKSLTGKGVQGAVSGMTLCAGNSRWLNLTSDPLVKSILSQGYTTFCFTINGSLTAVFGLEDPLRPDALSTVAQLHKRGISVHLVSGDDDTAVRSTATRLGIPFANVQSRCTAADKQAYVQYLLAGPAPHKTASELKKPVVIFCGDGTNDAAALAQATIGVHMNGGTDVARSAADVVLVRPDLTGILTIVSVGKKAFHRIIFNFGWSCVYNLFAVLLGAGAFVNARIPPEFAGLGELVSVLPVIAAAVLLRWSRV